MQKPKFHVYQPFMKVWEIKFDRLIKNKFAVIDTRTFGY